MEIIEISPTDVKKKMDSSNKLVLIDVRTKEERKIATLGGIFISLDLLNTQIKDLDPNIETIVYCHHGGRSSQAVTFLKQCGFKDVKNLSGGIDRWSCELDPTIPRY